MRLLITGITGFIGRRLAADALAAGHEVAGLVRASSLNSPPNGIKLFNGGLGDPPLRAIREWRPEVVVHAAWISKPGAYLQSPENEGLRTASRQLIQELAKRTAARFLILGTCLEYAPSSEVLHELRSPVTPLSPYAAAKDGLRRDLAEDFVGEPGRWGWVRIFYPYGEGEHPSRLATSLVLKLRRGEVLELKTPLSVKDYVHIADLTRALLLMVQNATAGVINLGTGEGVAVATLSETLARLLGRPELVRSAPVSHVDLFARVVADPIRLRSLGWQPAVKLERGLLKLLQSLPA